MRRSIPAFICAALALTGCGAGAGEGNESPDADVCMNACVPGWWTVVTGDCSALCTLDPKPRECGYSDCEQLEAHEFVSDGAHSSIWTTHSPSARSFTLILVRPDDSWSLPTPCEIAIGDGAPSPFDCEGDGVLRFSTRTFLRPSNELQTALETARAEGQCEHVY